MNYPKKNRFHRTEHGFQCANLQSDSDKTWFIKKSMLSDFYFAVFPEEIVCKIVYKCECSSKKTKGSPDIMSNIARF